jgi:hypothetical protein
MAVLCGGLRSVFLDDLPMNNTHAFVMAFGNIFMPLPYHWQFVEPFCCALNLHRSIFVGCGMTNDELRTAIAEHLGWKYVPEWNKVGTWVAPDGMLWGRCPNWTEDIKTALSLPFGFILEIVIYRDGSVGVNHDGGETVNDLAAAICRVWLKETGKA